ncbi:MAG: XRE family transcriptional regulator, partial [Deltaproteobacteria bacterium]|nr:XRE family transcriptional regulator [Deltaproteobacteria bacterium]
PALMKMGEVLAEDLSSFFEERQEGKERLVFTAKDGVEVKLAGMPEDAVFARLL